MKIISYNVRGLGGTAKRRLLRGLISKEQVDMICIQETKLEAVNVSICTQIWGDCDYEWQACPAVNRGGGLLCVWKRGVFHMQECYSGPGFMGLVGNWGNMLELSVIVNIYSPCRIEEKRSMWQHLVDWKNSNTASLWCLGGDFNSVRSEDERRGITVNSGPQRRDMVEFNRFIEEMEVLDLPLSGRKYTWVRPNGQAQSKIDWFLLSLEWLAKWPHSVQLGLNREFSDHCPVLLRSIYQDWGPKPFRVMNCWMKDHRFEEVVKKAWEEQQISGWGAFRLKEKLKGLKVKLKGWNKDVLERFAE
ncbi:uncharacterized protein LOC130729089 [Lotus japonicus]|uniref:uncharacterized protein LOC130729089 n=1 Tax=Lotus japonicus TaxID=34305 RepID=UPI002589B0E8|nr:uncharacterized protein LOC130729089 [Lotus japonicus]